MTILKRMMRSLTIGRTCSALNTLSDRQLADIGINRAGIYKHVASIYEV